MNQQLDASTYKREVLIEAKKNSSKLDAFLRLLYNLVSMQYQMSFVLF